MSGGFEVKLHRAFGCYGILTGLHFLVLEKSNAESVVPFFK